MTTATAVTWLSVFVDLPEHTFERTLRFWREVTGYDVSPPRGDRDEFVSLLPPAADDHVRVQRLGGGGPRLHVDLHVADPQAAARGAERLGADVVADRGHVLLRSPGGLPFCFVDHGASRPAEPGAWRDDETGKTWRSMVDQVCLDVPSLRYDGECDFWAGVLGADWQPSPTHSEFRRIPTTGRLRILAQRLEDRVGDVRAHLDLSCDDRVAEVRRHLALGARADEEFPQWTAMRDPAGSPYCITVRTPG